MSMFNDFLKASSVRPVLVAAAVAVMLGAVVTAEALKPRKYWADVIGDVRYENIAPRSFGDWEEVAFASKAVVDPVQAETLSLIYNETVARTYRHKPTGRFIMLSLAYGRNQSTDTQLHTPEQCYPSQGFRVDQTRGHLIKTPFGDLKSVQMQTTMGPRNEPLTYFIRVGDEVVRGSKERNLARLHMAVRGYLVDGLLVRVSEITNRADSFDLQDKFVADFLSKLNARDRGRVIGASGS